MSIIKIKKNLRKRNKQILSFFLLLFSNNSNNKEIISLYKYLDNYTFYSFILFFFFYKLKYL